MPTATFADRLGICLRVFSELLASSTEQENTELLSRESDNLVKLLEQLGMPKGINELKRTDSFQGSMPTYENDKGDVVVIAGNLTDAASSVPTAKSNDNKDYVPKTYIVFFGLQTRRTSNQPKVKFVKMVDLLDAAEELETQPDNEKGDGKGIEKVASAYQIARDVIERCVEKTLDTEELLTANDAPRPVALLLGNGINYVIGKKRAISWNDLLRNIGKECGLKGTEGFLADGNISSPIKFEGIAYGASLGAGNGLSAGSKDIYNELKETVASHFNGDRPCAVLNDVTNALSALNADSIITTNYDSVIEDALGVELIEIVETKYPSTSTSPGGSGIPRIYHAHGCYQKSSSICIGYEHYASYIKRIRQNLLRGKGSSPYHYHHLFRLFRRCTPVTDDWAELFFSSDLHILGLGLGFEEIDLWWLLTLRATAISLYLHEHEDAKIEEFANTITFHDIHDAVEKEDDKRFRKARNAALEAIGVTVNEVVASISKNYELEYIEIFKTIGART